MSNKKKKMTAKGKLYLAKLILDKLPPPYSDEDYKYEIFDCPYLPPLELGPGVRVDDRNEEEKKEETESLLKLKNDRLLLQKHEKEYDHLIETIEFFKCKRALPCRKKTYKFYSEAVMLAEIRKFQLAELISEIKDRNGWQ